MADNLVITMIGLMVHADCELLFHTLLELLDSSYQRLRQFPPRKRFFNNLSALSCP